MYLNDERITDAHIERFTITAEEIRRNKAIYKKAIPTIATLDEMTRLDQGDTLLKRELRQILKGTKVLENGLCANKLRRIHLNVNQQLNLINGYKDAIPTPWERKFAKQLRRHFGSKFIHSFWIGPYQLDIFIPNLRSQLRIERSFNGIDYEIDGPIHNQEFKTRKDTYREAYLDGQFRIITKRVINTEVYYRTVRAELVSLKHLRRLNHKTRIILERKMAIHTIGCAMQNIEFDCRNLRFVEKTLGLSCDRQLKDCVALVKANKYPEHWKSFEIETEDTS